MCGDHGREINNKQWGSGDIGCNIFNVKVTKKGNVTAKKIRPKMVYVTPKHIRIGKAENNWLKPL